MNDAKPAPPQWIKLAIDFGPVLVFFATYQLADIQTATIAIAVAAVVAVIASRLFLGSVSIALVVTSGFAIVFGGLTIALSDPFYLKIRPTIVNILFAATLTLGIILKRPFLKAVFGQGFPPMVDAGWYKLTRNFALFFLLSAALNELVWRNFSESLWVNFSSWGDMIVTFGFMLTQWPMIERHIIGDADPHDTPPPPPG